MFNMGDFKIGKKDSGIEVKIGEGDTFYLTDDDWISIITEMSYKPENADQHQLAEKFHLGK